MNLQMMLSILAVTSPGPEADTPEVRCDCTKDKLCITGSRQ